MPGYFETLSIPLLRGRTFTPHDDDPKAPAVAVVNRAFARRFFKEEDPIGQYITPKFEHSNEPVLARQIIGVVGDTRTEELWDPYPPQFFLPYGQYPSHQRAMVVMKISGDHQNYENAVRKVVAAMDSYTPVFDYGTFADSIGVQAAQPRFQAILVSGFAGVALFLSALGLYAVLSYIVSERIRELGLRIALGASRSDILSIVLQRALILAALGIAMGASVSVFATRVINDVLFNVEPLDRTVFLIVTLTLVFVSVVAALIPALRAANVDPMRTLREQ
jgi:ABC-type antimicrobial peptide transport system permease subunit